MLAAVESVLPGRRRRRRLQEAVHELRRSLQILALGIERECGGETSLACLHAAGSALAELDRVIERQRRGVRNLSDEIEVGSLTEQAKRRWRGAVELDLRLEDPLIRVAGSADELGAALDNLIANALEHGGGGPVSVRAESDDRCLRLVVANEARKMSQPDATDLPRGRHGHGLRLVGDTALRTGGRLHAPRQVAGLVETGLELPSRTPGPSRP